MLSIWFFLLLIKICLIHCSLKLVFDLCLDSIPFPVRFEWSKNIVLLQNKFFFIWKPSCVNSRNMILHFFKLTKNIRKLYINNSMTSLLNVEIAFFFSKSTQSQGKPFLELLGQRMLYIFTIVNAVAVDISFSLLKATFYLCLTWL